MPLTRQRQISQTSAATRPKRNLTQNANSANGNGKSGAPPRKRTKRAQGTQDAGSDAEAASSPEQEDTTQLACLADIVLANASKDAPKKKAPPPATDSEDDEEEEMEEEELEEEEEEDPQQAAAAMLMTLLSEPAARNPIVVRSTIPTESSLADKRVVVLGHSLPYSTWSKKNTTLYQLLACWMQRHPMESLSSLGTSKELDGELIQKLQEERERQQQELQQAAEASPTKATSPSDEQKEGATPATTEGQSGTTPSPATDNVNSNSNKEEAEPSTEQPDKHEKDNTKEVNQSEKQGTKAAECTTKAATTTPTTPTDQKSTPQQTTDPKSSTCNTETSTTTQHTAPQQPPPKMVIAVTPSPAKCKEEPGENDDRTDATPTTADSKLKQPKKKEAKVIEISQIGGPESEQEKQLKEKIEAVVSGQAGKTYSKHTLLKSLVRNAQQRRIQHQKEYKTRLLASQERLKFVSDRFFQPPQPMEEDKPENVSTPSGSEEESEEEPTKEMDDPLDTLASAASLEQTASQTSVPKDKGTQE